MKKVLALLVSVLLLLAMIPMGAVSVSAGKVTYSGSASYMSGKYYKQLCEVTLTGNSVTDIVNVAKSQIGYRSGASNNDLSGVTTSTSNVKYSEYGRVIGSNPNDWCAYFVSWCARVAGIPTSVLPNFAGCTTAYNSTLPNAGCTMFRRGAGTPQAGDIIFFGSSSSNIYHVGIVTGSTSTTVYYIDGNNTSTTPHCVSNSSRALSNSSIWGYARPNYGGNPPVSHNVDASYGKSFTAYPKAKITAENIFDENHNMVSSTAWIGTTDKCTIYEVYTDGCCKLSYPIDSGGSKTVYSKISLFNTHTHSYTGARLQEPDHPHVITQRCVDYATCGGYIVTGEYGQSKTCQQCWRVNWSVSASSISVNVGQSKSINVSIDGIWPDTAKVFSDWDESLFSYTLSQGVLTVTGLKKGTGKIKISIYSDANKSVLIGEKTISVTVSDPTYTGRVSFDKSSISLVMPDNKTSTLNIELTGTWPEGAGYTFDYNSNVVSMSQNGTVLTITAKNAGSTNFTINIVNKNNNNALITSAVCPITVKNATYTIKYHTNGGSGTPPTQTKEYGTPISIKDFVPERDGYIFKGWATSSAATTPEYVMGDKFTLEKSVTLYAVWQKITLVSIKTNNPQKLVYYMGEYLDTSGLRLRLEYSDGSTSVIDSGYTVSGFDSSTEGVKTVFVSYGGKTDSFEVIVCSSEVFLSQKDLTIHLGESKTIYATTNPVGGSVKWRVWNNKVATVSNGVVTAVGAGTTTIEVSFEWCGYYSFATCVVTVESHVYTNACDTTCNTCGATRSVTHSYSAATCTKPKTCSICGVTSGSALGHKYDDEYDATCNVCGEEREVPEKPPVTPDLPADAPAFVVESTDAREGEEFTVAVRTQRNSGIVSMKLSVAYDADVLELIALEEQDFANVVFSPLTKNPFMVNWADAISPNNTTDGVVVLATFRVKEGAPLGKTEITLTYDPEDVYDENYDNVAFRVENGFVEIVDYIPGDVNADGRVNNKDLGLLQQYLSGWDVRVDEKAGDVNADGRVNNKDLGLFQQYLSGWDVELG